MKWILITLVILYFIYTFLKAILSDEDLLDDDD